LLAKYYDALFGSFRSSAEDAREQLLARILPTVKVACDLACGTGTTALALARRGIRMYAVDLSAAMCRLTREKFARAGVPVRVIRADMRDFRLPETVDLVTCEFDAVNHVPDKADLLKVSRSAARALRPGGHFFFDVNNSLAFQHYWNGPFWIEGKDVVAVMRSGHSPDAQRAWSDVEWFVREGKLWRRFRERVEEVCWDVEEVRHALNEAGFDNPLIVRGCRTFYVAHKAVK
jgi:SAM-dependent methyltransferase